MKAPVYLHDDDPARDLAENAYRDGFAAIVNHVLRLGADDAQAEADTLARDYPRHFLHFGDRAAETVAAGFRRGLRDGLAAWPKLAAAPRSPCPRCGCDELMLACEAAGPHFARLTCRRCPRFVRWVGMPRPPKAEPGRSRARKPRRAIP